MEKKVSIAITMQFKDPCGKGTVLYLDCVNVSMYPGCDTVL